ncbi:MAG: uracil-DNA glycosylase family protein, partial [Dehalococcoidales bacterium]
MPSAAKRLEQPIMDCHLPQSSCEGCPFRGPKVGSKGNPEAPLVWVAESPGGQEVREGVPLIGPSGKIFHQFVPDNDDIYVLNAMECHPLQSFKNEKNMNHAAMCCHDRLIDKITAHPRRLVVAMGNPAVRSLTGDYSRKITKIRGRLIESPLAELGIMPVVHIAALMKGTGSFRQWREDILYALELGTGGSPREHIPAEVIVIPDWYTQEKIDDLFAHMDTTLTGDIETTGLDHIRDRILSVGVTPDNDKGISYCFYPRHFPY